MKPTTAIVLAASLLAPAHAWAQDAEPGAARGPYGDGVWASAGARAELDERGSYVALSATDFGGQDIQALLIEGQRTVGSGFAAYAGYSIATSATNGGRRSSQLARAGATFLTRAAGIEVDARLIGETLWPEGADSITRGRLRMRATVPLVGGNEGSNLRAFFADEVFVEGRGITRNRVNAGLRSRLGVVGLDIYWLREDRDDGRSINALVAQLTFTLPHRSR